MNLISELELIPCACFVVVVISLMFCAQFGQVMVFMSREICPLTILYKGEVVYSES